MINLTQTDETEEPAPQDEMSLDHVMSAHIRKVLATTRGDVAQAAQLLNIGERTLLNHVKKFRSTGLEIPLAETRGKARLTSSRE
jgi:ActR/RegA family two-component response regulator